MASHKDVKKVVLAYSGGLDTSIILKWLQTELGAEVVTFTADLGQGEELEPARKKAEMLGIKEIFIDGILKIGGPDFDELGKMLEKLNILSGNDTQIIFTISADNNELPESVMQFV